MEKGFSIIAAVDEKLGIGKANALPWRLSGDMQHFKEITIAPADSLQNVVIMGRRTWESLPDKFKPLPGRSNVVLTRNKSMVLPAGVLKFDSLQTALGEFIHRQPKDESFNGDIFVIGGAGVYAEAIENPFCRKLYITHVQQTFDCDAFFPEFHTRFKLINKSSILTENGIKYCFAEYSRF
jgi:dihydrofolate reductase